MTMPKLAAGKVELLDEIADELLDQLVDELTNSVQGEKVALPAEGAESWVEAQQFADRCRAAYLAAIERVRVITEEDEDQESEILLSWAEDGAELTRLGHSGCMHDSDCACSALVMAKDNQIQDVVLAGKRARS